MQKDERTELSREDRVLVDEIQRALRPPELTAVEQSRFDARLLARLPRPGNGWIGGLAWLPAVAATVLLTFAPMNGPEVFDWLAPLAEAQTVIEPDDQSWVDDGAIELPDPLAAPDPGADLQEILSDEYVALAYWIESANDERQMGGTSQQ